jgi:hypothetical protein
VGRLFASINNQIYDQIVKVLKISNERVKNIRYIYIIILDKILEIKFNRFKILVKLLVIVWKIKPVNFQDNLVRIWNVSDNVMLIFQ